MEVVWQCEGVTAVVIPGSRLLIASNSWLEIRDLSTGKVLSRSQVGPGLPYLHLCSNRKSFSCVAYDKFRIWDSFENLSDFKTVSVPGITWAAAFQGGDQFILGLKGGELKRQNIDPTVDPELLTFSGHRDNINYGCFTRDQQRLITAGADGTAKVWSIRAEEQVVATNLRHARMANLCFDADGKRIHYVSRRDAMKRIPHNAGTIDPDTKTFSRHQVELTASARWPRCDFAFSPDRRSLAAPVIESAQGQPYRGNANVSEVGIWSTDSWEKQRTIETGYATIHSIHWADDGESIAIAGQRASDDFSLKLFDATSGASVERGELTVSGPVISIDQHQSLMAVATETDILVYELEKSESGSHRFQMLFQTPVNGRTTSLDFSPDGSRLAAADWENHNLYVFDIPSGEIVYKRPGPRSVCSVCYSPCGTRLAMVGYDSIVHLCEAESGYRLLSLKGSKDSPGTIGVNAKVVFSPDGSTIATNTWRGKVRFWKVGPKK